MCCCCLIPIIIVVVIIIYYVAMYADTSEGIHNIIPSEDAILDVLSEYWMSILILLCVIAISIYFIYDHQKRDTPIAQEDNEGKEDEKEEKQIEGESTEYLQ
eukprot:203412_1